MRDILFRAKRQDNGEWVESMSVAKCEEENGDYLYYVGAGLPAEFGCDEHGNILEAETYGEALFYEIDPGTVGQHTGWKDKNGKRIFEGDIVRFDGGVFTVEYSSCRIGFYFSGTRGRGCVPGFTMSHWEHLEIIGNIHDNPELLQEA